MRSELQSNIRRRQLARAKKDIGRKRLVSLVGVVVVFYLVFLFGKLHWMNYQEQRDLNRIVRQTSELKKKYKVLKTERKKLEDVNYVKSIARTKLYLLEPNEVPIKIRDSNSGQAVASPQR